MSVTVKVQHIYEHTADTFEDRLNEAVSRIVADGGIIGDIKYASDPATPENRQGGFGALIIYEFETDEG